MTASSASAENTPLKADFQAAGNDAALKYLTKVASCKLEYMKTNVDDLACLSEGKRSILFFFLLLRNNGAATGIWPLITLTVNLIVDHTLTVEPQMRRRSQCVVSLNCTKSSVYLSETAYTCAVEPQCPHLAQSSKIAFARTSFYLQKAWSSHFLYLNFS